MAGVKDSEPVALFMLLYWAVLIHKLGDSTWWAGSVGRKLVQEISDILTRSYSQLAPTADWGDGTAWASEQVDALVLK